MKRRDLRALLGRRRDRAAEEREVREEMESHMAHRADELTAAGLGREEAEARARREFGDAGRLRRECLEARAVAEESAPRGKGAAGGLLGLPAQWDTFRQDLSFAVRQIRRGPGFAVLVALTLTLGIGATTSILAVVRAVVLAPLPFAEPDRLVLIEALTPAGDQFPLSEPAYLDWEEGARSFTSLGASTDRSATLEGVGEPRAVRTLVATPSLLPTLGVQPALGRGFLPEEAPAGAPAAVAILSHRLWTDLLGADPGVLGSDLNLNGTAHRVVGVLPAGLSFLDRADLLVPLAPTAAARRGEHYLDVWGRLAPGATVEAAGEEMREIAARMGSIHEEDAGWSAVLAPMEDVLIGADLVRSGWMLLAGAFLLLAIACVNVANLLLARATARGSEMGVRGALGAGRSRIVRQLLTESLVLATLGGLGGLALTRILLPLLRGLGAGRIPRLELAKLGGADLMACAAATLVAALVFGSAPALRIREGAPARALRSGRGGSVEGGRLRSGLVAAQIALSLVLLVTTGLLGRSFLRLATVDPGFDAEGTLTVRVSMPDEQYAPEERAALLQEMVDAVAAMPGVTAAGATVIQPFAGNNLMNFVARADRMPDDARGFEPVAWRVVTPGFQDALGLDLLAGRGFRPSDDWEGGTPVIVSRTLARRLWPGAGPEEAVGRTLVWGDPTGSRVTVVGVVEDLRDFRMAEPPQPMMFRPHAQIPWTVMTLVARVEPVARAEVAAGLRTTLRRIAPGLAVPEVRSLEDDVGAAVAGPRFQALLLGAFSVAGLLLAGVGVYGVTSFEVARRTREIGIRLAIGGKPGQIRRAVLVDTVRLAVLGLLAGAALAWPVGRWVESLLFATSPRDPSVWVGVVGSLLLAAVVAAWLPAQRATRIEPRDVLAGE